MPRILRTVLGHGFFHVWTVAVDGTPAFADDLDRIGFLRILAECVHGYEWEMYSWCLLTTHYHLVIAARQVQLSAGMQRLNGIHAQRANRRRERTGHLFGARFASRVVEGEKHVRDVCRYVLLNPSAPGLVERPEDWLWSWCRYGKKL
jgi:REP element-mobilizing transposase RayT